MNHALDVFSPFLTWFIFFSRLLQLHCKAFLMRSHGRWTNSLKIEKISRTMTKSQSLSDAMQVLDKTMFTQQSSTAELTLKLDAL